MQGNCSPGETGIEELSSEFQLAGDPLRTLQPNQCLIITDTDLIDVVSGPLWIDNVYVRARDTSATSPSAEDRILVSVEGASRLYLTHSVLQGDGVGTMMGLHVYDGGQVFLQGASPALATSQLFSFLLCMV